MTKKIILLISFFFSFTAYSQMTFGNAYGFNGSSAYYAVAHAADLALTTQATWEFWINPTTHGLRAILGKNYLTGWAIGTNSGGTVFLQIPGGVVTTTSSLPLGVWTHVAITYNSGTATIYFNGTSQPISGSISGSIGSNTDSLYIGCERESGVPAYFFHGMLDNIRIWNVARTLAQIQEIRFTPVQMPGVNLGPYSGLVFSAHADNLIGDWSGPNSSTLVARGGAITVSYNQRPVHYNDYNSNFYFDGTSYLSGQNVSEANPTTAITVECWIKRDTTGTQPVFQNIFNKSGGTNRYDWALYITSGGTLYFSLNNDAGFVSASSVITRSRWYHIAGTWSQASGQMKLYINGDSVATTTFAGPINNNPDSICVGGIAATSFIANKFRGQIDNPRVWSVQRTTAEIRSGMYVNNSPPVGSAPYNNLEFSFDALTCMPRLASSASYYIYPMAFRGSGIRLVSSHLNNDLYLTSPLIRDNGTFEMPNLSPNWFLSTRRAYLPDPGTYHDSIFLPATDGTIKVLVLLNHTWISDMTLTLRNPTGTQVVLTPGYTHNANDMMVIFDQAADSTISTFLGQAPYSPLMRPANSLAPLQVPTPAGWWRLTFSDVYPGDQGYINGWGVYRGIIVGHENPVTEIPNRFYLEQNYPNPFNPVTTIKYGLAKDVAVKIKIYDIVGREVKTLKDEFQKAGSYEVMFDGSSLASGTYFYRIEAGDFVETKKMILVK